MLARLKSSKQKIKLVFLIALVLGLFNFQPIFMETKSISQEIQATTFFLEIFAPTVMEYWQEINITVQVTELANSFQENISVNITLGSGLYIAETEDLIHNLGNFSPLEVKNTTFLIIGSQTFLTNPIVLYKVFLHKDETRLDVSTRVEGLIYTLQYGIASITIQFPILKVDSTPIELEGFVVPRVSLLHNQEQSLTYNISNVGVAALKNLTFQVIFDEEIIEITSTVLKGEIAGKIIENISLSSTIFPNLDLFPGSSHILFQINIRCISTRATDYSRVFLYISSDFFNTKEYSVKIQTYDTFNIFKYDNSLVFFTWPLYILFFTVLAIGITIYSLKKYERRVEKAKELEKKYGTSYID